jgi:hypothetical protein
MITILNCVAFALVCLCVYEVLASLTRRGYRVIGFMRARNKHYMKQYIKSLNKACTKTLRTKTQVIATMTSSDGTVYRLSSSNTLVKVA